jgi:hypothetical protein
MNPEEMRRRACRYRDIARSIIDARTIEALHELADEYEALAEKALSREVDNQEVEQH